MKKEDLKRLVILEILHGFDRAWLDLDKVLEEHNASSEDCFIAHEILYKIEHEIIVEYKKEG